MVDSDELSACRFPSSELSHCIFAIAISHVSRTDRLGSLRYCWSIGSDSEAEIAPIASAAYLVCAVKFPAECALGTPNLMSNHWIFGRVFENAFEYRKRGRFLHLPKTIGQLMLE
jgi:hypothetical protein